ncbi:hypothetical protein B0T16DRAFT_459718 [Cercophora newfieldiana]|uniref:Uncharacterized protein n=1 Tax=Cercophora newfieldiana TaxID=92897 RepID=A0AA39Y2Z7_9PEZI|nr:hypothetical protein B0T16DRAFT_459718 [Cercophora newfieldiana]
MNLKTLTLLLTTSVYPFASAQGQPLNVTGAPLPGTNVTGLSTEGVVTVVTVVGRFLTFCAEPTVFRWGEKVYDVKGPTTLTIEDCPCTITTTRCLGPDCYYKGPGQHATMPKGDGAPAPTANLSLDASPDLKTKVAAGPGPASASASAKGVVVSGAGMRAEGAKLVLGAVIGALVVGLLNV